MNKNRLVALGLILFVLLFTFPVLMNLGKSVAKTQPPAMLQDQKAMQELAGQARDLSTLIAEMQGGGRSAALPGRPSRRALT